jgi:hypothetical protein
MYLQTLEGNRAFDELFFNKINRFSLIISQSMAYLLRSFCSLLPLIESAWNFNSDNIITEDSVNPTRGREDRGASRTPLPEIGFMLGSATAR